MSKQLLLFCVAFYLLVFNKLTVAVGWNGSHFSNGSHLDEDLNRFMDLHNEYCRNSPLCSERSLETVDDDFLLCCSKCSCTEDCAAYGTCCPDILGYLPKKDELFNTTFSCIRPEFSDSNIILPTKTVWINKKCADTFADDDIISKCKNPHDSRYLEEIVPVTDVVTMYTYWNYFCAVCNFVEGHRLVYWRPLIDCVHSLFIPQSANTFIGELREYSTCGLYYEASAEITNTYCLTDYISDCNVTGNWKEHDAFIQRACQAYKSFYNDQRDFSRTYMNVFCFLCNGGLVSNNGPGIDICLPAPEGTIYNSIGVEINIKLFQLLAESRARNKGDNLANTILDSRTGQRRRLLCKTPYTYVNGTCRSMYSHLKGVYYETFVTVTPLSSDDVIDIGVYPNVTYKIRNVLLDNILLGNDMFRSIHPFWEGLGYKVQGRINGEGQYKYIVYHFALLLEGLNRLVNGENLVRKILDIDDITINIQLDNSLEASFKANIERLVKNISTSEFMAPDDGTPLVPIGKGWTVSPISMHMTSFVVTKPLVCPLVELSMADMSVNSTGILLLELDLFFHNRDFFVADTKNTSIVVCAEMYVSGISKIVSAASYIYTPGVKTRAIIYIVSMLLVYILNSQLHM